MKQLFVLLTLLGLFTVACDNKGTNETAGVDTTAVDSNATAEAETEVQLPDPDATGNFGAAISAAGAIPASEVVGKLKESDSLKVKLRGTINACCQAKGCWMTMPLADNQEMMVKFKDYGFFVPKNSTGKEVVVEGWAYRELVSVDELRHYAEDEGKSKDEIAKITQPEERITFMADGVIVAPGAEGAH